MFNQNHEVRLHTLEQQINMLMRERADLLTANQIITGESQPMFGIGLLNHEYRLKALESNDEITSQRLPAINKELAELRSQVALLTRENTEFVVEDESELRKQVEELKEKLHVTEMKRQAQSHSIAELQHAINNSDKRISQLFDVIGTLIDERRETTAIIKNVEAVYSTIDKRLSNLGYAVGQHEEEIAMLVDFKNALSTTGIVMKVANVAAVNNDEDVLE